MKPEFKRVIIGTRAQIKKATGDRLKFRSTNRTPSTLIQQAKDNDIPIISLFPTIDTRGRHPKVIIPDVTIEKGDVILVVGRIKGVLKFVSALQINNDYPPTFSNKGKNHLTDSAWR